VLYDTDHNAPIGSISNLHYATITDIAWSFDGSILFMSSTDGFCSMVEFTEGELGEPIPRDEWLSIEAAAKTELTGNQEVPEVVIETDTVMQVDSQIEQEEIQVLVAATIETETTTTTNVERPPKDQLEAPTTKKRRITPTFLGSSI
jgi:chromatin assembly factor 1 subunit B